MDFDDCVLLFAVGAKRKAADHSALFSASGSCYKYFTVRKSVGEREGGVCFGGGTDRS